VYVRHFYLAIGPQMRQKPGPREHEVPGKYQAQVCSSGQLYVTLPDCNLETDKNAQAASRESA
jgi:hypothetical protein